MAGLMTRIPEHMKPMQDRFRGCLLGGAVGDALGAPVEFMSRKEILATFGPEGITDFAPAYCGVGRITDDTQMTLFTADGLIRSHLRGTTRGIVSVPEVIKKAYVRWLVTQGLEPQGELVPGADQMGWLGSVPELFHRRAPGNTCLSALQTIPRSELRAENNSKGCGGVMRVAPIGLVGASGPYPQVEMACDLAYDAAAITHGHPSGRLAAVALMPLIILAARGDDLLTKGLPLAEVYLGEYGEQARETIDAVLLAYTLAKSNVDRSEAIARLGEGWVAEEALAISVYCALVAKDFRDGVTLAVNHDGDSDSTGAITGNILGARWGAEAIPEDWLARLELREVITELADDLLTFPEWPVDDVGTDAAFEDAALAKYPPV